MLLKNYQKEALSSLSKFVKEYSSSGDIEKSFKNTREAFELPKIPYAEYTGLSVPSVCFRVPTGGGKTLLAVHSLPILVHDLLEAESSLIFWLAPSDPIVSQTITALKDRKHPYRVYLEQSFPNRTISIMSIDEAYQKAFDITTEVPIIIATIQTFSVEAEDNRRFYSLNGAYQDLFTGTNVEASLYEAVKHSNPIIIMDEAHNAKTDLRVSKLIELNPSFMLELTATPQLRHKEAEGRYANNVLYTVSASQLKAEDMIKLPIVLETIDQWQLAIKDAIEQREALENLCKLEELESKQYIRPIILFKAESKRGKHPITYEMILETLLSDYNIDREEIAVHTSGYEELKGKDLMSRDCKIKYVVSIDALKEGWDAPFAYILASVGDMNSSTAVEQILGRILRMPYAKKKSYDDLEKAYAFIASSKTAEVIKSLKGTLIENGFEKLEADIHISVSSNSNAVVDNTLPGFTGNISTVKPIETLDISTLSPETKEIINYNKNDKVVSIVSKPTPKMIPKIKYELISSVSTQEEKDEIEGLFKQIETHTISNNFSTLSLPVLLAKNTKGVFVFDKSILLEEIGWSDQEIAANAILTEAEFDIRFKKELNEIDISDKAIIESRKLNEIKNNLFTLNGEIMKLNEADVTQLILRRIKSQKLQTLKARQLQKFVLLVVVYLVKKRGITTIDLKSNLNLLINSIFDKIKNLEETIIKKKYDSLFADNDFFQVDPARVFTFDPDNYPVTSPYNGEETFNKHYYKIIDKMDGEEETFAKYLDDLEAVEFWVRNIDRASKHSFWLQTASDRFYPDFIVKLTSGSILVIEYKGKQYKGSDDVVEKESLGLAWAHLVDKAGFAMVYKQDYKVKVEKLIKEFG